MVEPGLRTEKIDAYAPQNLRFRKAFIRERLEALRAEREALLAEREKINEMLAAKTSKPAESTTA